MGSLFPIQIIPDRIIYYAYFFEFKIVEKKTSEDSTWNIKKIPITIS